MPTQLTEGAIRRFFEMPDISGYHPICQINASRHTADPNSDSQRYKVLLSDGINVTTSIFIGEDCANKLVSEAKKFSVIRVDNSHIQRVNEGRKALIIVGFTVLEQLDAKIGEPTKLDPSTVKEEVPAPIHNNNAMTSPQIRNGSTRGLVGMTPSASQVQPITSLNPYQNKWLIKARVSKKSDIRTWSNARGEGKLFSMELCDESGEIRCTGFTEAVDRFYNVVEQGKVYYISRCNLKTANKQYTNVKNDYEMQMTNDTSIVRAEDDESVPEVRMNYTQIADIDKVEPNAFVDIAGVATQIGDVTNITSKAGKELTKREIKIQDKSGAAINLTLWGNDAINFDSSLPEPVVAVKGAKVSDFGGRTVSVSFNSTLMVNPDIQHSHELKGWYMKEGRNQDVRQMSGSQGGGGGSMETAVKSFVDAKASINEAKPEYFANTCVLTFIKKDNCMYKACPSADCNKKVTQEGESEYRCEKCNRSYPNFDHRLMMNAKFADASGVEWITLFQENAEKLIGKTSSELGALKESDEEAYERALDTPLFDKFTMKIRGKLETWNDETRIRMSALHVEQPDVVKECERLLSEISMF